MTKRTAARAAPEAMTEKELLQSIRDAAKQCGWLCFHTWSSIHSPRGLPDLVLCHPERHLLGFWELKSERGKVSDAQRQWLDALAQVPGIIAKVIRPADLEAAYRALVTGEWPKAGT